MGHNAEVLAACFRGQGFEAEALPLPNRETLRIGRRHTSGKECLPLAITLGGLLQRLEKDRNTEERFAFFMPTSPGPCRFGVYNLLHKIALQGLGWRPRVRVVSPSDSDYFEGVPGGFTVLVFTGFMTMDLLQRVYNEVRPIQARAGAAERIFTNYRRQLVALLQSQERDLGLGAALLEVVSGRLFGTDELLRKAARETASLNSGRQVPTVLISGEIYNRLDPFANDFIIDKLVGLGIRAHVSPFTEWIEYTDCMSLKNREINGLGDQISNYVRKRIQDRLHATAGEILGWPPRMAVGQVLRAAAPYVRQELEGDAVLTVGSSLLEFAGGHIDGVILTGPLECMPTKIAEAQLFHIAAHKGLPSLTLALNGDPIDPEILESFVFEIRSRFRQRCGQSRELHRAPDRARPARRD
jgi:predicted nucleotide-binding protein (sugar kinase/HSP70/actin superfamily)